MSPLTVIYEAFISLSHNKVRTGLSVLGIVIGIASVIAMVAVGEGARQRVERQIESLGDDWLTIRFWGMQRGGVNRQQGVQPYLAESDADAIGSECPAVRAATPSNTMRVQVVSSFRNHQTSVQGVYPDYFDIRRWRTVEGRLFTDDDMIALRRVCCIGQSSAAELFGGVYPIGQTIRVNRITFEVVGLLETKGTGGEGRDFDDVILFPWRVFQRLVAGNEISQTMYAAAAHGAPLSIAREQIRALLRQRHRLTKEENDDFRVVDRSVAAQASAETTRTFNWLLMTIACISLVVGGVGIMNVTLVSVTERTREIGTRMAIGANGTHILGQFLTEAVVLCAVGGLFGFLGGVLVAQLVSWRLGWDVLISTWMALLAILFSTVVGLTFGFYPAWRASRLDPIEALRYE
ncbi:MAG: ABC transporter permease [Planctomycetes bacterium]|nr:ABC transporter permease [Planctomycetota bacterium]